LVNTVGELTIANADIDFFVSLIRYTISVIVVLCFPELLSKFGEARFARFSSLRDPLVTVEELRPSKKRRPKQHRDDQSIAHVFFSGDRLASCSWTALQQPSRPPTMPLGFEARKRIGDPIGTGCV
jgi:hypothetical protein